MRHPCLIVVAFRGDAGEVLLSSKLIQNQNQPNWPSMCTKTRNLAVVKFALFTGSSMIMIK